MRIAAFGPPEPEFGSLLRWLEVRTLIRNVSFGQMVMALVWHSVFSAAEHVQRRRWERVAASVQVNL